LNMKKILYLITLAFVAASCVKTDEPTRFSILGDSYSAFEGYVHPSSNDAYPYEAIGVTGAEQMWWAQVADSTGWVLERNNSFSGALVCNYDYVDYYGEHSFIRRMNDLGNPDVIFVFGATNDACAHDDNGPIVPLGDFVYSDWTEGQLCAFRPGLAYLFHNLRATYPHAKLYFLLDMKLGSGGISNDRKDAFIKSIHQISNHYDVDCIDLQNIHKISWHPDAIGQRNIAEQVLEYIAIEGI